jgi:peptide chain release factor 2
VLHPYQMVKDHRTGVEAGDAASVLGEGRLDPFIEAALALRAAAAGASSEGD